jgi:type II secretory pathway pseudopilin PulG
MDKLNDANKQRQAGLTLLGVLVATLVFVTILIATMNLMSRTTREIGRSQEQFIATNLAREGLELVQHVRDTNFFSPAIAGTNTWTDRQTPAGMPSLCTGDTPHTITIEPDLTPGGPITPVGIFIRDVAPLQTQLFLDNTNSYTHDTTRGNRTEFAREMTIICNERNTADKERIEVTSRVTWQSRGTNHDLILRTHLYNWYQ